MKTREPAIDWDRALPDLQIRVVETARGPIEVALSGAGPAVVLIHGTPGSWRQAIGLADDLRGHFQVLLPSRPGYGRTSLETGSSPGEQAAAYAALVDALEIRDCVIVGISGGGPSAAEFAAHFPERTRGLVLACAIAVHLMKLPRRWILQLSVPGLAEFGFWLGRARARRRINYPRAVEHEARRSFTPDELRRFSADERVRLEYLRFLRSHLDAPPGLAGMRNDVVQMTGAHGAPDLSAVTSPSLILHGDADATVSIDQAHFYAGTLPKSELEIYEQAGHLFLITRREEAVARILEFLQATR